MRTNKLKVLLFFCAVLSLLLMVSVSHADTIDTQLSSDKVTLGDTVTLSFVLNSHSSNSSPDFSVLENDFRVLSKNYGNAVNMINGVTTRETFWQLTLEPKKTGEIIIPEIDFGHIKSTARKLMVEETTPAATPDSNSQDAPAFVQAEVSTTTPYLQSQVLYTFKLFYQSQLENPRVEVPQIKDATFIQVGEGSHYKTTVKGKPYFVAEKHFALFPQKSGKMSIPAFRFNALTYDVGTNRRYDPFYNVMVSKTLSLSTPVLTLDVRKIPPQSQGSTWLPAKNVSLTDNWSAGPDQWETGNPVVRTITVEAQGLRADQIPDFSIDKISGVNTYVDPPRRSNRIQDNTVIGTLQQKVTYIPNILQSFTIPVLKLNWWNVQTNKNALAQLNSVTIQAKGNSSSTIPIAGEANAKNTGSYQTNQEAVIVNEASAEAKIEPFYKLIWFWIAVFLLVTWLVTLWFIWNKKIVKKVKLHPLSGQNKTLITVPQDISEKSFTRACKQGDAPLAQQFLLSWAKKQRPDLNVNLTTLCEMTNDKNFKQSLKELEQAIYANKETSWNGQKLLAAYQQVKKQWKHQSTRIKSKKTKTSKSDPLPPLNP